MERLENDIVYVTVYLNNGYSYAGYMSKDDIEDALNGYYNDDKYFMRMIEERQGLKIGVLEEIAYRNAWITKEQLEAAAQRYGKSSYGRYLTKLTENKIIY